APSITANAASASYQWLDCNNNYAIIPGETAQVFTATANGSYAVEITALGCVDTSVCTTISNIGVEENTSSRMLVYPNPANENLQLINLWPGEVKQVVISNAVGQEVLVLKTTDTQVQVDIKDLVSGVYFLLITAGENSYSEKVIIKR